MILAGGSGARVGGHENKVFLPLGGQTILEWSIATMRACRFVEEVVVACRPQDRRRVEGLGVETVAGGPSRHLSESNGIEAVAAFGTDVIAVHDGARPLATPALTEAVLVRAHEAGGAVPWLTLGVPVFCAGSMLDPASHVRVQTPQAFRAGPLIEAFRRANEAGFEGVDTAETAERFSDLEIALVPGEPANLKITYPEDLARAERSLR